ncbi:MAG: hypothetical protein IJA23_00820, partial [Clostridia bacterium]|nr:hypothetical protein [Clostridia bacterium]
QFNLLDIVSRHHHYYAYATYDYTNYNVDFWEQNDYKINYDKYINDYSAKYNGSNLYVFAQNEKNSFEKTTYTLPNVSKTVPIGYEFKVGTTFVGYWDAYYYDFDASNNYVLKYWGSISNFDNAAWNKTYDFVVYAHYSPINVEVHYYLPTSNLVAKVNKPASSGYYKEATVTYAFNQVITVPTYELLGYTFKGWLVSTSTVSSQLTDISPSLTAANRLTSELKFPYDTTVIGTLGDYSNGQLNQDWIAGNSFYFRSKPTGNTVYVDLYAYAFYEANTYNIHYYVADTNDKPVIGVHNSYNIKLQKADDNRLIDTVVFNTNYKVPEITAPIGYTFVGWSVDFGTNAVTDKYLNSYQQNNPYQTKNGTTDDGQGATLKQTWAKGTTFVWRNRADVSVYAVYAANDYSVEYYVPQTNKVDNANHLSTYIKFDTKTGTFNAAFTPMNVTLVGYTFRGWYIKVGSAEASTYVITDKTAAAYCSSYQEGYYVTLPTGRIDTDSAHSSLYLQDWSKDASFNFRYTTKVYAYAYYTVNERDEKYQIDYFVPKNNLVGSANDISKYESTADASVQLNFNVWFTPVTPSSSNNVYLLGYTLY